MTETPDAITPETVEVRHNGFIEGLEPVHVSDRVFKIMPGVAYIPALGRNLELNTEISVTLPFDEGGAYIHNAWYVYIYEDQTDPLNPTVKVEAVTNLPVQYFRDAQHKNGAPTHRRIAMLRYDGNQELIPFGAESLGEGKLFVTYELLQSTNMALSWPSTYAGFEKDAPIGPTAPKVDRLIPSRCRMVYMKLVNHSPDNYIQVGARPAPLVPPPWSLLPEEKAFTFIRLRDDQVFSAAGSSNPSGGVFQAYVLGYYDQR